MPAARYEIRIRGRLSAPLLSAFDGLLCTGEPVETVVSGRVEDQAALYAHLQRVQSLGLELVEVRRIHDAPDQSPDDPCDE